MSLNQTVLKCLPGCVYPSNEGASQLLCRREQSRREPSPFPATSVHHTEQQVLSLASFTPSPLSSTSCSFAQCGHTWRF